LLHDQGHLQFLWGQRSRAAGSFARGHHASHSQFRPGLPGPRLRAFSFEVGKRIVERCPGHQHAAACRGRAGSAPARTPSPRRRARARPGTPAHTDLRRRACSGTARRLRSPTSDLCGGLCPRAWPVAPNRSSRRCGCTPRRGLRPIGRGSGLRCPCCTASRGEAQDSMISQITVSALSGEPRIPRGVSWRTDVSTLGGEAQSLMRLRAL
jgi:hypothetical protein